MTQKTDHSFHIGEQHRKSGKPCQDYALSGVLESGQAYAIVSDGCSSGGMTDIGARLMVLATKQALDEHHAYTAPDDEWDAFSIVNSRRDELLEKFCRSLDLSYRDLLATSMWAVAEEDWVAVNVTGDGVVALQFEYDTVLHYYNWNRNVPYYPAYRLAGEDESFKSLHADVGEPLTYVEVGMAPIGMGGIPDGFLSTHNAEEGMAGMRIIAGNSEEGYFPGNLLSIALFSDGVEQIDQIPREEAVKQLMSFKSTNGQFVVRRMNRFLTDTKKIGRGPIDDIAMATIHVGHSSEA